MNEDMAFRIRGVWDQVEGEDPEVSTERLLAMTVDRCSMLGVGGIDSGDVAEALEMTTVDISHCPHPESCSHMGSNGCTVARCVRGVLETLESLGNSKMKPKEDDNGKIK